MKQVLKFPIKPRLFDNRYSSN